MSQDFRTSFRGYDPADVDRFIAKLRQDVAEATAGRGEAQVEIRKLTATKDELARQAEELHKLAAELKYETKHRPAPTFTDLGANIGSILTLADEEAAALRDTAEAEAAQLRNDAEDHAQRERSAVENYAAEVRSKAEADAAVVLEKARREADDILDFADRESHARREEAEALYERQRAESTTAVADFERTLAERRERVAEAFTTQMEEHERLLAESVLRRDEAEAEAKRLLDESRHQSRSVMETARDEADQLLTYARNQAERIKTESERELAAANARRNSITSQLANVRQMIGTLGGGMALPATSEQAQVEAGFVGGVETVDAELVSEDDLDAHDAEVIETDEDVETDEQRD